MFTSRGVPARPALKIESDAGFTYPKKGKLDSDESPYRCIVSVLMKSELRERHQEDHEMTATHP